LIKEFQLFDIQLLLNFIFLEVFYSIFIDLKMSDFNDINYELSSVQNQSYLFQNKYFEQELLLIEENQDRKVSFYSF
jgi:hypothetical protein